MDSSSNNTGLADYDFLNPTQAFKNVYTHGGGLGGFWRGTSAKMVESASKGAILLYAKEGIANALLQAGVGETLTG